MVLFMLSCRHHEKPLMREDVPKVESVAQDNLFRYARNVVAYPTEYGYWLEVLNPWDSTAKLGRFALVHDSLQARFSPPTDAQVVSVPVKSVISFSSTQWSVFMALGKVDLVKGILEGRDIHSPEMRSLIENGKVKDVGTESAKNIELMIQMRPDILLYSPYFDGNQDPLKVTGAALFPFADYLEHSPLGRAEWIRVVGLLAGCPSEADAWFDEIERRYLDLKDLCSKVEERPTVFSDLPFNGQWYVAGGKSYIAQLFADAGVDYVWKDNASTASFPLDSETILAKARHADYWRIANSSSLPMTYESLRKENALFALFDAYRNRHVIVCDIQPTGYFETSQMEPDALLADFIYFFHPERMKVHNQDYHPKYYHLLEK